MGTRTVRDTSRRRHLLRAELIGKLARVNRDVYNRQLAVFSADHDRRVDEARKLALAELRVRKDVYGYDTAAWASYKAGRLDEARRFGARPLSLETRDPRLYYHAGMIAKAQGRRVTPRRLLSEALSMNSHFDLLQASVARAALDDL